MVSFHNLAWSFVSLALAGPCFGWGGDGHRIVGTIASAALTEDAAKSVRELLGDQSIADACCWADDVRSDKQYNWLQPLHYINAPRNAQSIDMKRDGADGQQIVSAILKYRDILKDTSRPKAERVEALKILLHTVGDVHQPFHVSYKEDKGGNMLSIQAWGKKSNMHKVFDSELIARRLRDTKGGWAVMSADLRQAISEPNRKKWSASSDPVVWANESFAITRDLYVHAPDAKKGIDDAYYQRWMPVVNQRLQAAGVRLAAVLNDALQDPTASGKAGKAAKPTKPSEPTPPVAPKTSPTAPVALPVGASPQ